jgi:hypothetical protein
MGAGTPAAGAAINRILHEPAPGATEEEHDGKIRFAIAGTSIPGCALLRSGWSHFSRRINA